MAGLEQYVKSQFERIFSTPDWRLYKEMAEVSFSEAAFLKKRDFNKVAEQKKLLVRNSRKRLLIGIGAELLLKAIYLKTGYCINTPKNGKSQLKFPFKAAEAKGVSLDGANTYMLNKLIDHLTRIITLRQPAVVAEGLKIAKVFRNKEGHVVTPSHRFDPRSFRAIEKALVALYADVFGERLTVRFSLEPRERAAWTIEQ